MSMIDNFKASVAKAKDNWTKRLQQAAVSKPIQPVSEQKSPMFLPKVIETKYGFFPNTELRTPTVSEKIQMLSGSSNPQMAALKKPAISYQESPYVKNLDTELHNSGKAFGEGIDNFIKKPSVQNALNMGYSAVSTSLSSGFAPISAAFKTAEQTPIVGKPATAVMNYIPEKVITPFVNNALKPLPGENKYFTDLKQNFLAPVFNTVLTIAFYEKAGVGTKEVIGDTLKTVKDVTKITEGDRNRWELKDYNSAWKKATGKELPQQVSALVKTTLTTFPDSAKVLEGGFKAATDNIEKGITAWPDKRENYRTESPSVKDFDKYSKLSNIEFSGKDDMKLIRTKGVDGQVVGVKNRAGQTQMFEDTKVSTMEERNWPAGVKQKFDTALFKKDTKAVQELLPQVPQEYQTRFKNEISALTPEPNVSNKAVATEVAAPKISSTETNPVRTITGLSKSVEAKAIEEGLTKGFSDLSGFDQTKIKIQAEKASEMISTDFERARRIAFGEEAAPTGTVSTAIFKAVEELAIKEKDVATLQRLASSKLTEDVSGAGQLLSMLQDRDKESAVSVMKSLSDSKRRISEKRTGVKSGKQVAKVKKEIDTVIKKSVKVSDWTAFIESIKC